ncbi:MAG: M23 family metallopeptidase, partial [Oscillospiraceae bacterium]
RKNKNYSNKKTGIYLKHIMLIQFVFCLFIVTVFNFSNKLDIKNINNVKEKIKTYSQENIEFEIIEKYKSIIENIIVNIEDNFSFLDGQGGFFELNSETQNFISVPKKYTFSPAYISYDFASPLDNYRVTSNFGFREHPIIKETDFHTGIDLAAFENEIIKAPANGEVIEVGENKIYGKYLKVMHGNNVESFYGHCNEILVKEGDFVKEGDEIAKVGSTGMSTGNHLHFEIKVNNYTIDPLYIIKFN